MAMTSFPLRPNHLPVKRLLTLLMLGALPVASFAQTASRAPPHRLLAVEGIAQRNAAAVKEVEALEHQPPGPGFGCCWGPCRPAHR